MHLNLINKQLKNDNFLRLIAGCLVFPAYIDFFISKSPVWQGLAYLTYTVPLAILFMNSRVHLNLRQIGFWLFFLSLWIVPSLINLNSGRLESDRIIIHALTAKLFFLTVIIIFAKSFFQHFKEGDFSQLMVYILTAYLPMILIIFLESIDLSIACHFCRVKPFNNLAFFVSELFYLFIIVCLPLKNQSVKICLILLGFLGVIMVEGRAALIASLIAIIIFVFYSKKSNKVFKILIVASLFLTLFALIFHFQFVVTIINDTFIYRYKGNLESLSNRIHMYNLAIESIRHYPWLGIGFEVTPSYYSFLNHNYNVVHNFILRIATENGLPVALVILAILTIAVVRMIRYRMPFELAFLVSFIIFNSFSTRHLSLNLMNVLLYIIIVKAFMTYKRRQSRPA